MSVNADLDALRELVAAELLRVRDVFAAWDEDGSGMIERSEWSRALKALFSISYEAAGALFDVLDVDNSGSLSFREVSAKLRPGAVIELDSVLQAGALGDIETTSVSKHALRKDGPQTTRSRVLRIDVPTGEGANGTLLVEQIRNALAASWTRVKDLFVEWDEDGSGAVDKREFVRALALLGVRATRQAAEELFASFDQDGSGTVTYDEMQRKLRAGSSIELDVALKDGALAFEVRAKNKFKVRKVTGKTGSNVLNGLELSKGELGDPAAVTMQLRLALNANRARTMDLFREWDKDQSGQIDKEEFCKAVQTLELPATAAECALLFDSLDDDHSGTLE